MEQKNCGESASNHDEGKDPQTEVRPIWSISGTAIAIHIFLIGIFLLWVFLPDYVPDRSDRAKVFIESMFSLAIVVVVIVHAMMYFKQAKVMDAQSKISERLAATALRQYEITDRPWLAVSVSIISALTFDAQGGHLRFIIVAKNVGRSVAVNATIHAKIVVPVLGGDVWSAVLAEQLQVCQSVSSRFMSYAVFPDDAFPLNIGFQMAPEQLEQGRLMQTDIFSIYLVGCADYQFSGHDAHHQTRFVYEVMHTNAAQPHIPLGLSLGQEVPQERLVLRNMIIGGGDYAD